MKLFTSFLFIFLGVGALFSQNNGDLDLSFNATGYNSFAPGPLHDNINRIAALPDGKIIFAGQSNSDNASFSSLDVAVGRVDANGLLDASFGVAGFYKLTNAGGSDFGYDMEVLPNGKILIGGGFSISASNTAFLVIRLNVDGTPDNTFDGDGYAVIDIDAGEDYCRAIFPQADGSVICLGTSSVPGFTYNRVALCKLGADGSQNMIFGEPVAFQFSNSSYQIFEGVQVGDNLYACGSSYDEVQFGDFPIVVKFNTSGVIDASFGSNGFYDSPIEGYFLDISSDGNMLHVAGTDQSNNNADALIAAFSYDGALQTNFGVNGYATLNATVLDVWNSMAYQSDGKILAAGVAGTGFSNRYILAGRFNADGTIDTDFGTDGYITFDYGSFFDVANDVTTQADGKIVIGGVTASDNNNMLLIRLQNGPVVVLPLVANLGNSTSTTCYGDDDGEAYISVSGGVAPYTYFLNGGSTNVGNTIPGLVADNYEVLVTDAVGTTTTVSFVIEQPDPITVLAVADGNDISVAAAGGTPPYIYGIVNGSSQSSAEFLNLPLGLYDIFVVDAANCEGSTSAEILVATNDLSAVTFAVLPTASSGKFVAQVNPQTEGKLSVLNGLGQCVYSQTVAKGQSQVSLDLDTLPSGSYMVAFGGAIAKIIVLE